MIIKSILILKVKIKEKYNLTYKIIPIILNKYI